MTAAAIVSMTEAEWRAEGLRRFGPDQMSWKFVCPCCKHVANGRDYTAAGAPSNVIGFSCIGRWLHASREAFGGDTPAPGPCNYAGGGLFKLNPVHVQPEDGGEPIQMFAFAEDV